jgi:glycosyltransferase involved in cell wall biosynthesis
MLKEAIDTPLVSIIITTKNEAKNIENCLLSIQEQSYPNIETIVVDNASTDKTKEIAKQYTDKVYDKGPERSAQRNYGMIDIAQGEYVMFLDADMILAPEVVTSCLRYNNIALHIPEIILGKNYWSPSTSV